MYKLIIALLMGVQILYSQSPSEIVEQSLKNIRYSKFDKEVIETAKRDPEFYTLKEGVKVKIKEVVEEDIKLPDSTKVPNKGIDNTLVTIEKIVNIASKFWDMIVDNKPVVNLDTKYAVALPMGVSSPSELDGWSKPKSYIVSFYFENLYGIDVISVSYKITYVYGGKYKGKGKYLAAVWAIPQSVDVWWGFRFSMQAYVPDSTIVNVGTAKDPVAAMQLKVSWSASSVLKEYDGTAVYYIQGDGYFEEIASPFRTIRTNLENIKLD